jgi:hypothetical protein
MRTISAESSLKQRFRHKKRRESLACSLKQSFSRAFKVWSWCCFLYLSWSFRLILVKKKEASPSPSSTRIKLEEFNFPDVVISTSNPSSSSDSFLLPTSFFTSFLYSSNLWWWLNHWWDFFSYSKSRSLEWQIHISRCNHVLHCYPRDGRRSLQTYTSIQEALFFKSTDAQTSVILSELTLGYQFINFESSPFFLSGFRYHQKNLGRHLFFFIWITERKVSSYKVKFWHFLLSRNWSNQTRKQK